MKLTRYEHACVRFEIDGAVVVVDAGDLTDPQAIVGADVLLYTHSHYDHFNAAQATQAMTDKPDLVVAGPAAVIDALGAGSVLTPGTDVTVAGVGVQVVGGRHADIFPGRSAGDNVGLVLAGRVYHPGDALALPEGPVDVALLPVYAPWGRLSEFAEFAAALSADTLIPIHDGFLTELGMSSVDKNLGGFLGEGAGYRRVKVGEEFELA